MFKKNWYLTNNHILFLLNVIIMYYLWLTDALISALTGKMYYAFYK